VLGNGPACSLASLALRLTSLTSTDVWWRMVALGGSDCESDVVDYLEGASAWSPGRHNVLAQALNEALQDLGLPHLVPFLPLGSRPEPTGADRETEAISTLLARLLPLIDETRCAGGGGPLSVGAVAAGGSRRQASDALFRRAQVAQDRARAEVERAQRLLSRRAG
jgi:hypothetical protein